MNNILRLPQVIQRTGLSKSSIYAFISNGSFPKSISIGKRAIGWQERAINDWIDQRIKESNKSV